MCGTVTPRTPGVTRSTRSIAPADLRGDLAVAVEWREPAHTRNTRPTRSKQPCRCGPLHSRLLSLPAGQARGSARHAATCSTQCPVFLAAAEPLRAGRARRPRALVDESLGHLDTTVNGRETLDSTTAKGVSDARQTGASAANRQRGCRSGFLPRASTRGLSWIEDIAR